MNKNSIHFSENNKNNNQKKFDFKQKKKNAINSLNEVEHFLRNTKKISKYFKLYKIAKK